MKRLVMILLAVMATLPALAQSGFGDYYDCRLAAHRKAGMPTGAVVWMGDSLTEQAWWGFLTKESPIVNRGIGGDNTRGMLARLPEILDFAPRKIFLMAGVNDLSGNRPVEEVAGNVRKMLEMIRERVPGCQVYLQSVITPNNDVLAYAYIKNKQHLMRALNKEYQAMCEEGLATWVDLTPLMHNEQGELKEELTKDGIHLHPEAYEIWVAHLKKMKYLRK
ncbi:MAG: GDSL family lipase [Alistipes sp.]|nr:GDSL family lipase [Alistipes sp.]